MDLETYERGESGGLAVVSNWVGILVEEGHQVHYDGQLHVITLREAGDRCQAMETEHSHTSLSEEPVLKFV